MDSLTDEQANEARGRILGECRKLQAMVAGLTTREDNVADQVHEIRKLGKSLRGAFAMMRLHKSSARDLQAIGRLLSAPRDAVVRLATWEQIGWEDDPGVAAAIRSLLEQGTHGTPRHPPEAALIWCGSRIESAMAKLEAIQPEDLAKRAGKGFRKLDKRVRKRCRKLDRDRTGSFHEARKAIKAWLGAIAHLPEDRRPGDPGFRELAKLLGDENDLAVLSAWLEEHGFTRRFAPALHHEIGIARGDLQLRAVACGTAF